MRTRWPWKVEREEDELDVVVGEEDMMEWGQLGDWVVQGPYLLLAIILIGLSTTILQYYITSTQFFSPFIYQNTLLSYIRKEKYRPTTTTTAVLFFPLGEKIYSFFNKQNPYVTNICSGVIITADGGKLLDISHFPASLSRFPTISLWQ